MKSIYLALISIVTILLLGCQPDPEVQERQAAQALEQLSDEELAQVQQGVEEGKPLTGQGYQSGSIAAAAASRRLSSLPRGSRAAIIKGEISRRERPCSYDSECSAPQICGINNAGAWVCESRYQPVDSRCRYDRECANGLLCVYDEIRSTTICRYLAGLLSLGAVCLEHSDCMYGVCGARRFDGGFFYDSYTPETSRRRGYCESPNQPEGSDCIDDRECASPLTCFNLTRDVTATCNPSLPSGSPCYAGGIHDVREFVCETETPACTRNNGCASRSCVLSRCI